MVQIFITNFKNFNFYETEHLCELSHAFEKNYKCVKTLNFEQMEQVNGGKVNACDVVMFSVGLGIGALGLAFTSGAAAWMFGYATWISGLGVALCHIKD